MTSDYFNLEKQRLTLRNMLSKMVRDIQETYKIDVHGAILDTKGSLIDAVGPNPLHYGVFETVVKSTKTYLTPKMGETLITNDPYSGNTRLCDLVLIQGAYGRQQANELRYYISLQVSLPQLVDKKQNALFSSVEEEGFRIPPTSLEQGGALNSEIINYLSQSGIDKTELTAILEMARGILKQGALNLISAETKFGREVFVENLLKLNQYSESSMRKALHEIPDGDYLTSEIIETDGFGNNSLRIQCRLMVQGENILVSFGGTAKQTKGPYNCNYVMTLSACFWFFRSLVKTEIPINAGAFKAFSIEAPEGTLVNAKYPAPLLGGYYETTKRIVDCLYLVLTKAIPAESQAQSGAGGGLFIKTDGKFFADILESGAGATADHEGESAIYSEIQNSSHSSIEEIEKKFSIIILSSRLRHVSKGEGKRNGGSGLSRTYKFLNDATLFALCDKRQTKSKGLFGGTSGHPAEFFHILGDKKESLKDKKFFTVKAGDHLIINTPGGGAWGKKPEPGAEAST